MNAKLELTPKQISMFFGPLSGLPQMYCSNIKNNNKKKVTTISLDSSCVSTCGHREKKSENYSTQTFT